MDGICKKCGRNLLWNPVVGFIVCNCNDKGEEKPNPEKPENQAIWPNIVNLSIYRGECNKEENTITFGAHFERTTATQPITIGSRKKYLREEKILWFLQYISRYGCHFEREDMIRVDLNRTAFLELCNTFFPEGLEDKKPDYSCPIPTEKERQIEAVRIMLRKEGDKND